MLPRATLPVNALLALVFAGACAPTVWEREPATASHAERRLGPRPETLSPEVLLPNSLADSMARGHIPAPPYLTSFQALPPQPPARPVPEDELDLEPLGAPIRNASMDLDLGQTLEDYVSENISNSRWNRYGLAALTYEEIWGETGAGDGLCEPGALLFDFEEDGVSYEASYSGSSFAHFVGSIDAVMESMDAGCEEALLAAAGDLAAVEDDCDEYVEHTFFPEGSDCRTCIEERAGDYAACEDDGVCLDEAPTASFTYENGEKVWARTAMGYLWGCAPDLPVVTYIMADLADDGTLPTAFDHAAYKYFCVPYWDPEAEEPAFGCSAGGGGALLGHTLGVGAVERVNYLREVGGSGDDHADRLWYSSRVYITGIGQINHFWATVPGAGQISMPYDDDSGFAPQLDEEPLGASVPAGWQLNPYALRPDGTDPTSIDDTFARDWLATLTLKTATTIDGIYIATYNHNRCDAWEGPNSDGSYRCTQLHAPEIGWRDDVHVSWSTDVHSPDPDAPDFHEVYMLPMATIGSTGQADPDVPGGQVVLVAGSDNLADPEWEDCDWPHQFTPDTVAYEAEPLKYGGEAWLWGDTYKFGKDPELDLRMVLNTNDWRGFCPER